MESPQTTRYDNAEAIVVNPTNGTVNVTGFSGRRVGRAFEASPGPGSSMNDFANDIAVDPTRGTVVITGESEGSDATGVDYAGWTTANEPNGFGDFMTIADRGVS